MGLFDRWRKTRPMSQIGFLQQTLTSTPHTSISECVPRQYVTVVGAVEAVQMPSSTNGRFTATVSDGTGSLDLIWHNRKTHPRLNEGNVVVAAGTVAGSVDHLEMVDPKYSIQVAE